MKSNLYINYTYYEKVASSNYDFHTGGIHFLGIGNKIVYFLVALMTASLPITGFMIWWGRRKKKPTLAKKATLASHQRTSSIIAKTKVSAKSFTFFRLKLVTLSLRRLSFCKWTRFVIWPIYKKNSVAALKLCDFKIVE